jgi:hypothetical protein
VAVQLSPNGKWVYGDSPGASMQAAFLANTAVSIREEPEGTWVSTSQGVAVLFTGKQMLAIYNIIKDMTITVV